jgi:5'-3' exonuclease
MQYDFVIIDAYNMAYRQWWNVKDLMYNGIHTGLEYGLIKKVVSALKTDGDKLYLAWDGQPVRCSDLVENYKSGRVKVNGDEPNWSVRLNRLRTIFSDVCNTLYHEFEEADEQIAKFVLANKGKRILICSNDKDMQQFICSTVHVELSSGIMDNEVCHNTWKVPAYKIPLYKSLDGDKSDNIDRVPRLATKTIIKLVNKSETIDDLIGHFKDDDLTLKEREKLEEYKDKVRMNYSLVNLLNLQGEFNLTKPNGDKTKLLEIIKELNFSSITGV